MKIISVISGIVFVFAASNVSAVEILKQEPGRGKLKAGAVVFVDDGTCGKGKVKQVTGGNQGKGVGRQSKCVATPK